MRKALLAIVCSVTIALLISPATAVPPTSFTDADAQSKFGHTFKEEYWTAKDVRYARGDANLSFAVSYAQYKSIDAFLVAFNNHTKGDKVGTLPFQLFGLHYYTPLGNEVLIGAVLAFLMAFNDTYNGTGPGQNGLPDPGNEDVFYIVPFGVGESLPEEDYAPVVEPMSAKKLGDGHFQFGQTYRNLYAKIIDGNNPLGFILTAAFPIYIAKFTELTVTYDIKVDEAAGTVTAETFYTIGQVTKLWLFGQPVDPSHLDTGWGLCAAHYVVVFTSKYAFTGENPGVNIATNVSKRMGEDLSIRVGGGREKAFTIGHRGTFDLINETSGATVKADQDATAVILHSTGADYLLLAWQALFALDVFATASWAVSESLQDQYSSPKALWDLARFTFTAAPLWYGTSFPKWQGYKVVHDPTYTGFADVDYAPEPAEERAPSVGMVAATVAIVVPALLLATRRTKN